MSTRTLEGRVAIVTGASRGIGRAIAVSLAEAGAAVALAARDEGRLAEVAEAVRAHGVAALVVPTDVTRGEDARRVVERTVAELGGLDVLVNNSGVLEHGGVLETSAEAWRRVFATNLDGVFLCSRAAGAHLTAQGSGKVINIASNFAFKGVAGLASYCASKAAVVSLTRSLAVEWARHGVQVNAIAPGYFETDMNAEQRADAGALERIVTQIPARRMGRTEELAPLVTWLASSASDFVTGETIVIDGGQLAR